MTQAQLFAQLDATLEATHFEHLGTRYQGKVRDSYHLDDQLILITTDRISAFDHILRQTIPFKGQVLNQLAAYFFEETADVMPNHVREVPDPNVTIGTYCTPVPIEFVVRGYLAGHAWRVYQAGGRILCGQALPEGLHQNSQLPAPILTPATKAASGHDEDISREEILARGLMTPSDLAYLEQQALRLFQRGTEKAAAQGLILVDTKYEFGRAPDGRFLLIDEVHTPDSSRYFYADTYEALLRQGKAQRQLSKEFVREWLMEQGFQGKAGQRLPDLTDAFRVAIATRYIELFERVTGTRFVGDMDRSPERRIYNAITALVDAR